MVELVLFPWTRWYPSRKPIIPVTKIPKKNLENPTMVIHDIKHKNEIGYCKKLANDMVIQNMQLFFIIDARIV